MIDTRASSIDWDALEQQVSRSLDLLQLCWKGTEKGDPDLHRMMVRDLYVPLIRQLDEFCAGVRATQ